MDLRAEGDLLVVGSGARIPKVCLKCGVTKDVVRREHAFAASATGANTGAVGGAIGAGAAAVIRNAFPDDLATQSIAVGLLFTGVIVVAFVVHGATPKIHLSLPLCRTCDARWEEGVRYRNAFLTAIGLFAVGVVAGLALDSTVVLAGSGLVFVLSLVVALGLKIRTRFVESAWSREGAVALRLDVGRAAELVKRAEKRAKKSETREGDDDSDDAAIA